MGVREFCDERWRGKDEQGWFRRGIPEVKPGHSESARMSGGNRLSGRPALRVTSGMCLRGRSDLRPRDAEPKVSAVGQATSRKAREVAHPQLFRSMQKTNRVILPD